MGLLGGTSYYEGSEDDNAEQAYDKLNWILSIDHKKKSKY